MWGWLTVRWTPTPGWWTAEGYGSPTSFWLLSCTSFYSAFPSSLSPSFGPSLTSSTTWSVPVGAKFRNLVSDDKSLRRPIKLLITPRLWLLMPLWPVLQVMYLFLHTVKGTPFETPDQGKARLLTHWEQMDYGVQFTSSRKFLTISPIVLWVSFRFLPVPRLVYQMFKQLTSVWEPGSSSSCTGSLKGWQLFSLQVYSCQFLHKVRPHTFPDQHLLPPQRPPPQVASVSWSSDIWDQQILTEDRIAPALIDSLTTWGYQGLTGTGGPVCLNCAVDNMCAALKECQGAAVVSRKGSFSITFLKMLSEARKL